MNYEKKGASDRVVFYLIDEEVNADPLGMANEVKSMAMFMNSVSLTDEDASDFVTAAVTGFIGVIEDLLYPETAIEAFLNFRSALDIDAEMAAERIENTLLSLPLIYTPLVSLGIWHGGDEVRNLQNDLMALSGDAGFNESKINLKRGIIQLDRALRSSISSGRCSVVGILRAED